MHIKYQRNLAFVLLVSTLLQSCVPPPDVPVEQGSQNRKSTDPAYVRSSPAQNSVGLFVSLRIPEEQEQDSASELKSPNSVGSTAPSLGLRSSGLESDPQSISSPSSARSSVSGRSGFFQDDSDNMFATATEFFSDTLLLQHLYDYTHQSSFISLEELVGAFNQTQDTATRQILWAWLRSHVDWFNTNRIDTLSREAVQEYAFMAKMSPTTREGQEVLQRYFSSLVKKTSANILEEGIAIEALDTTLWEIDETIFRDSTSDLIEIGNWLLTKVDPRSGQVSLDKSNYPNHARILSALYNILLLVYKADSEGWLLGKNRVLYSRFQITIETIKANARYYPYVYYTHLLDKSLESLNTDDAHLGIKVWQGIKALARCYDVGRKLINEGKVDLDAIEKVSREIAQTYRNMRESMSWLVEELYGYKEQLTWYERLGKLSEAALLVLGGTCLWDTFNDQVEEVKRECSILSPEYTEGRKAFQYGVISQLTMVAALHKEKRADSIEQLKSLAESKLWNTDQDIMEAIFEGLISIAKQEHRETSHNKAAKTALGCLKYFEGQVEVFGQQKEYDPNVSKTSSNSLLSCFICGSKNATTSPRLEEERPKAIVKAMAGWLDKETVERKLEKHTLPQQTVPQHHLLQKIKEDLIAKLHHRIYLERPPVLTMEEMQTALRCHYQEPHFKVMPSFLGEALMSVEVIECHLKLNEQKKVGRKEEQDQFAQYEERLQWVKTRIEIKDLFKKRSLKPKEPEKEIHKVLLVGEAGTGKTSLTKKVAHAWAKREWGQEFQAVYMLPMRALRADKYDNKGNFRTHNTLATAITNICFTGLGKQGEFQELRRCIVSSLNNPTTLVIIDGLDEQHGASEAIINEAKNGKHKLLLTSRPYGISTERSLVDIEVDHVGLDTAQRDRFVRHALAAVGQSTADSLLTFIKYNHLAEMAQVPVNLKILCALWKQKRNELLTQPGLSVGLPTLYRKLVDYIWERFEIEKPVGHNYTESASEQAFLFRDLETIALASLQRGVIIIQRSMFRYMLGKRPSSLLEDAGFLLFQKIEQQYQFPHLTFQEYFAGRRLARLFLSYRQDMVGDFLKSYMYIPRYRRTLAFMSGELSNGMQRDLSPEKTPRLKISVIQELLQLLALVPQDILGLQHVMLQLRLFSEWLLVTENVKGREETLAAVEGQLSIEKNLIMWFNKGLRQYDNNVRSAQILHSILLSLLSEAGGVTKHYNKKLLSQIAIALDDSSYSVRSAAVQALPILLEKGGSLQEIFSLIQKALDDSDNDVRSAAVQALPILLEKGGGLQEIFPLIQKALDDSSYDVRSAAVQALPILLEKGGSIQEIFPLIQNLLAEKYDYVRSGAVQALPILLEKGGGLQEIFSLIQKALGDSDNGVRSGAVQALPILLEKGRSLQGIFPLIQNLLAERYDYVRRAAVQALPILLEKGGSLQEIFPLIQKVLGDSDNDVRSAAVQALPILLEKGGSLQEIFSLIQKALGDSDNDVRSAAVQALPILLEKGGSIQEIFPLIQKALGDSDKYVRSAAVQALPILLEKGGSIQEIFPLIQNLLADQNLLTERYDYVRSAAMQALPILLEKGGSVQETFPLIQKALGDSSYNVRRAAVQALPILLAKGGSSQEIFPLIQKALGDSSYDVRSAAVQALPILLEKGGNSQEIFPLIQKALGDSSYDVRSAVVQALPILLEKGGSSQELFPLIQKALGDSSHNVRSVALQTLQILLEKGGSSQEIFPLIQKALGDSSYDVRSAAVQALPILLEKGGSIQEIFPLIQNLLAERYDYVRSAAMQALPILLEKGGSVQEIFPLIQKALGDSSYNVRRAAVQALPILLEKGGSSQEIFPLIQKALGDSSYDVRSAALQALPILLEKGGSLPEIFPLIQNLLAERYDYVRRAAVQALPILIEKGGSIQEILPLIQKALGDSDKYVRSAAVQTLQILLEKGRSSQEIFPLIQNLLAERYDYVRSAAVQALQILLEKGVSSQEIFPLIQKALGDSDWHVRSAAVQALPILLEKGGSSQEIFPLIQKALGDSSYDVRSAAVQALPILLGKSGSSQEIFSLIQKALSDSSYDVRSAAVQALPILLEKGGSSQEIFPLIQKALGDSDWRVRSAAVQALPILLEKGGSIQEIFPLIQKALGNSDNDVRSAAVQALPILLEKGESSQEIFPLIQKALGDSDWHVRSAAVQALPILLEKGGSSQEIFPLIQKALGDSDWRVRSAAVQALPILLEKGGSSQEIFSLIQKALGDSFYDVRNAAVQALPILLEKGGNSQEIFPLIQKAFGDSDNDVRNAAVQALPILLEKGGNNQEIFSLIQKALGDSSYDVRSTAVQALPILLEKGGNNQEIFPLIQNALGDSDSDVRRAAVAALQILLEKGGSSAEIFPLIQKALGDSSYDVRHAAVSALQILLEKGVNSAEIFPLIQKGLGDSSYDVRRAAVAALPILLEKGGSSAEIFPLIQKGLGDSSYDVRRAAVAALPILLEKGGSSAEIFPLIQNALGDSSYDVRSAAVAALPILLEKGGSSEAVFPLIQNALAERNDYVRSAAVAALPILLEKGGSSEVIFPLIQNALAERNDYVRSAAVAALQILLEKGGSSEAIFPLIQNALGDSSYNVRRAAVAALRTLIEKSDDVSDIFSRIKETLEYRRYNFSQDLREGFEKYATDSMIDYYWATKDESIMPFLIPRLYEVALTVEDIKNSGQQKLVLRSTKGDLVKMWKKPKEALESFKKLIRTTSSCLTNFVSHLSNDIQEHQPKKIMRDIEADPHETLKEIEEDLESAGWKIREAAVKNLTRLAEDFPNLKEVDVVSLVRKALSDEEPSVRQTVLEIVPILQAKGINLGTQDEDGATLLHDSAQNGYIDVVKYLTEQGADVDIKNSASETALDLAKKENHQGVVNHLLRVNLERAKSNLSHEDHDVRKTAVENLVKVAQSLPHLKETDIFPLLQQVLDLDKDNKQLDKVSQAVCEAFEILVNNVAMLLQWATQEGYLGMVNYLGGKNPSLINMKMSDEYGTTLLNLAVHNGHLNMIKHLCERGANAKMPDGKGWTPLLAAAEKGYWAIVKYLVEEEGVSLDQQDKHGATPLYIAAQNGHLGVVEYLCEKGANTEIAEEDGLKPLDIAALNKHHAVVNFLRNSSKKDTEELSSTTKTKKGDKVPSRTTDPKQLRKIEQGLSCEDWKGQKSAIGDLRESINSESYFNVSKAKIIALVECALQKENEVVRRDACAAFIDFVQQSLEQTEAAFAMFHNIFQRNSPEIRRILQDSLAEKLSGSNQVPVDRGIVTTIVKNLAIEHLIDLYLLKSEQSELNEIIIHFIAIKTYERPIIFQDRQEGGQLLSFYPEVGSGITRVLEAKQADKFSRDIDEAIKSKTGRIAEAVGATMK